MHSQVEGILTILMSNLTQLKVHSSKFKIKGSSLLIAKALLYFSAVRCHPHFYSTYVPFISKSVKTTSFTSVHNPQNNFICSA